MFCTWNAGHEHFEKIMKNYYSETCQKTKFGNIVYIHILYLFLIEQKCHGQKSDFWNDWSPKNDGNNNSLKLLAQYCIRFNYQHWHYTGLQYQPNTMRKKWHPTDCHPTNTDVGTIIDQVVHVPLCTGIIRIRLGFSFFLPLVKFKKKRKNKIKRMLFQDLFNLANPHL